NATTKPRDFIPYKRISNRGGIKQNAHRVSAGGEGHLHAGVGIALHLRLIQRTKPGPRALFHEAGARVAALLEHHCGLPNWSTRPRQGLALHRTMPILERLTVQIE